MYQKFFLILVFALSVPFSIQSYGQDSSKTKQHPWIQAGLAPAVLATGSFVLLDLDGGNHTIIHNIEGFRTHVDDYLGVVPLVGVYALNLSGVKGKHRLGEATWLMFKSELLMAAIVFPTKNTMGVLRPDGSSDNSYPSGHTAQAFVAATFLHKEYGEQNIWYSIGGYSLATATGVLRILNNRHRLTDVLMGAGIGIFSTNVVYLTHKPWHKKSSRTQVHLTPTYDKKAVGFSFLWLL